MASMAAKSCNVSVNTTSLVSPSVLVQEKASRNKRKYRADPPLSDLNRVIPLPQSDSSIYEFSAEKFEIPPAQGQAQSSSFDLSKVHQELNPDSLKLDLGLPSSSEVRPGTSQQPREEVADVDEGQEADWSDPEETELEKLALSSLDTIFKSAIKKLVSCGYSEEVALRAVLRLGLCYGPKDMVTNIVENTLPFLRSIQGMVDPAPRDHHQHHFGDLQQLEKYVLAEMVCVLREVRPFFSVGDAMWCLLICDMNVSHACAMDGDSFSGFNGEGDSNRTSSSTSASNQSKENGDSQGSEFGLPDGSAPIPAVPCSHHPRVDEHHGSSSSPQTNRLDGEAKNLTLEVVEKSFSSSHSQPVEKSVSNKKVLSSINKREYLLRQKSLHLEKHSRTHGCKGSSRAGKLSSLSGSSVLEKKPKPVSDSNSISLKTASLKITKAVGVDLSQENSAGTSSTLAGPSTPASFNPETTVNSVPELPKTSTGSPPVLPVLSAPHTFSGTNTELSLSLTATSNSKSMPIGSKDEGPNCNFAGIPYDKSAGQFIPRDKKDETILSLIPRIKELQNQLNGWNEWANQKVMQAARRLSKDKAALKLLRQEKEEVERLKKEKQNLEESTIKKLSEMENALCKASGQVERANAAVRRLESENAALRQEMEVAKLHATESAANFQEVLKREKKTLMKFQSWEKQKALIQEELATEKGKLGKLSQEVEQAKNHKNQIEARWRQEKKAKEDLLAQGTLIRKEREESEAFAKSKEDMIKLEADNNFHCFKEDIQKLEKEISELRLKTDSSKIAALRRGIVDGTYASRFTDRKTPQAHKEDPPAAAIAPVSDLVADFKDCYCVKRERECVMCLSEETCVVFLPCAHQVVCKTCNELHERQGMKDCPSCRCTIQRRITVRYAPS
ncbi:putative E3 ubiquitin-protein ligase RF298 [Punica granatum]|uniref:E3 ubiquitin-protein ligase RF298 n=1 Tax=Punica granatum TaxID=22663 RepID=A0A6P8E3P1_PUNGR|nr:putative E3 ubiquitin-protein ligase RF298 [Punica granatum]